MLAMPSRTLNQATSGSGALGPESAPRARKLTTFAKGSFQPFNLPKFSANPVGEHSVLPQRPTYL